MSEIWILLLLFHLYLIVLACCEIEFALIRGRRFPWPIVAALLLVPEIAYLCGAIAGVLLARKQARKQAEVNAAVAHLEWPKVTGHRHCHWQCRDCSTGGVFEMPIGRLGKDDAASHALETGHRVEVTETGSRIFHRREEDPHGA